MKVGNLVKYVKPSHEGVDYGTGIILIVLTGGSHRKHASASVMWSGFGEIQWHPERHLEVISE